MFTRIVREIAKELCKDVRVVEAVVRHPFKVFRDSVNSSDDYKVYMFPFFGKFIPFRRKNLKDRAYIYLDGFKLGNVATIRVKHNMDFPKKIRILGKDYEVDTYKVFVVLPEELKEEYRGDYKRFKKEVLEDDPHGNITSVSV